jgi:ribosomal protein L37E
LNAILGKTCPYCQTPIKPGEAVVFCSACGMPHHRQCWDEARGCTTFGCNGNPVTNPSNHDGRTNLMVVDIDSDDLDAQFCSNCGSPVYDVNAAYCSRCGISLQNIAPRYPRENEWTNAGHDPAGSRGLAPLYVFLLLLILFGYWTTDGFRVNDSIDTANNQIDVISKEPFESEEGKVIEDEQEEAVYQDIIIENENSSDDGALNPIQPADNLDTAESLDEHPQSDWEHTQNYDVLPQEDNSQFTDATKSNFEKTNASVVYLGCYDDTYNFGTTFSKARTKTITAELALIHPSPNEVIYFDLLYLLAAPDGTLLDSYAQTTWIEPGWTESYHRVWTDLDIYGPGIAILGVFDGDKLLASQVIELTE